MPTDTFSSEDMLLIQRVVPEMQLFRNWPEHDVQGLIEDMRLIRDPAGRCLLRQGEIADGLYAIAAGSVEVSADHEDGRRYIRRFAQPGMLFGLVSVLDGKGSTYSYVARANTKILFVRRAAFLAMLARNPELWPSVANHLGDFQRMALALLDEHIFERLHVRLTRVLVSIAKTYGTPVGPGVIGIKITQDDLGNLLGVTRQSVSKELKRLEQGKLVRIEYGQIMLTNVSALARSARDYTAIADARA